MSEFKQAFIELGLTDEEAELELEDMGFDMFDNKSFEPLDTEHFDITGFAQVGSDDFYEKEAFEKKYLKFRIHELIGSPPPGAMLKWNANQHDFGTYHDMLYCYNPSLPNHEKYRQKLENLDMEKMERSIQSNWDAMKMEMPMNFLSQLDEDNKVFDLI